MRTDTRVLAQWACDDQGKPSYRLVVATEGPDPVRYIVEEKHFDSLGEDSWQEVVRANVIETPYLLRLARDLEDGTLMLIEEDEIDAMKSIVGLMEREPELKRHALYDVAEPFRVVLNKEKK